jgi:hypothetical protein
MEPASSDEGLHTVPYQRTVIWNRMATRTERQFYELPALTELKNGQ